ncbi:hypothetical protein B0H14DRAFT_3556383 [Mycena olivaceomarginata]|nr:hypothetical protein B0H14DRAFT_3556383 [Mycena olivaceomarginata]
MASDERAAVQPLPDNPRPVSTTPSNVVPFPGSFLPDGNANARVVTDNESAFEVTKLNRLINTLQECFTNLLKEQKEQTNRLIEELKPKPPPVTDKKTVFWNMYKTLADEHDKELLQRYSTDLDTALIFVCIAGLFSAVDSAFIIQIQPEFQLSDPGLSLVTLIAQSLLYISLGSTLLAALLAVLGKQWLMYYSAAGERGTIETRGLERQRKLDGLRKWKFDTVMQMFPLLLQFGLFLFAAALSVYLWKIHHVLASIVLGLSFVGTLAYIFLLASAIISQDSPFQTPLVPLVTWLLPKTGLLQLRPVVKWITRRSHTLFGHISAACLPYIHPSQDPLPRFSKQRTRSPGPKNSKPLCDAACFPPSQEVPAVSWVLETSTDPVMLVRAAEVAIDLQWPITIDVEAQKNRLWENFLACFDYDQYEYDQDDFASVHLNDLRDGMDGPAVQLGCAYYTLCRVGDSSRPQRIMGWVHFTAYQKVQNVINLLAHSQLSLDNLENIQWILHLLPLHIYDRYNRDLEKFLADLDHSMPILDCSGFTDYLFCVYAFLSPGDVNQNDIVCMDKSSLLKVDGWVVVVLATGQLTQWHWSPNPTRSLEGLAGVSWVYEALESAVPGEDTTKWDSEIAAGVSNLLLALYYYDAPPLKKHIHLIVKAISMGGHTSRPAGLLLLRRDVVDWFHDPQLGPILQHASVWKFLVHWALRRRDWDWYNECILLGHMLSEIPDWRPHLEEELCSWITLFFDSKWDLAEKYNSVLTNIWHPPSGGYTFITPNEEALGLTYAALSGFWKDLMFLHYQASKNHHLGPKIYDEEAGGREHTESTPEFKAAFSVPLQNSLVKVVAVARDTISSQSSTMMVVIEGIAKILEDLVNTVAKPTDVEKDWDKLYEQFDAEINQLEESLQNIKLSASPVI